MNALKESSNSFIVTTSARGASRSQIWRSNEPLKIGFPMQWLMESTADGVRITYLGGKSGHATNDRVREIPFSELKKNPVIQLRGNARGKQTSAQIDLRIEPAAHPGPVFAQPAHPTQEQVLGIYKTRGNWVTEAHRLDEKGGFTASIGSVPAFSISREGPSGFKIAPRIQPLVLARDSARSPIQDPLTLSAKELAASTIGYRDSAGKITTWRFGWLLAHTAVEPGQKITRLPTLNFENDPTTSEFKKQVRNVGIGLAVLLVLALVWPKPHPQEELIPPQLAKIILTPPKHMAAASNSAPAHTAAQRKVQQSAVVQAFRAKALQSAVSKLMKGGMTRLLAQSDFIAGHRNSAELGRILNTQSKDLRDLSPQIGGLASKNIAVASLGGEGAGGKGSVGYGKGEHASVNGQGKAFVSMDMANSQVDDGLTKDQVGEVIHRHLSEVRYCYEASMIRMPDIEGKLVVDFTIGGNGMVKTAEAKQSTLPDPRLDDCILRRLATWKFPNPRGGVNVSVTYPFIFKTLGR